MLRSNSLGLTLLLGLLAGLGPLTVDMYLASLPDIGRLLDAPAAQVQLTISVYLVGHALGQVFYGSLSDRHGRRPVLMAALAIYVVASAACLSAVSIELLIGARFVQALGGSGASVLARAVVRDMYEGARVGRELSRMASIMAIAPLIAPLLGGALQTAFGWRSNFVVLTLFGVTALSMIWLLLPETLRQRASEPVSLSSVLRSYRRFFRDRGFVVCVGIATCCMAGLFSWISIAAFVLQEIYGFTPFVFGIAFAVGGSGYLTGTSIGARVVVRLGSVRTLTIGTVTMAVGGLAMLPVLLIGWHAAVGIVLAATIYLIGMGMAWPQAQAGALMPFPDSAGAASSLLGVTTQSCAAIVGAILGHSLGGTAWPLAIGLAAAGSLAVLLSTLLKGDRAAG